MNVFDRSIQIYLIDTLPSSGVFAHAVGVIAEFSLFKGLLPLAVLWAMWFKPGKALLHRREMIVATLSAALLSFVVGRLPAFLLPFRLRPVYDASLHLAFPLASQAGNHLRLWSSFPSDHAALWMSIALGILLVCRWIGILAILHFLMFICLPRIYLGLHYPTDVFAGAVIGATLVTLLTRVPLRRRYAPCVVRFMERRPAVGYMLAFLFFFELATMFDEPRVLALSLVKLL